MVKAPFQSQFQFQTKHYHRPSSIVKGMLRQSGSTTRDPHVPAACVALSLTQTHVERITHEGWKIL
jgi:hypothetical protein